MVNPDLAITLFSTLRFLDISADHCPQSGPVRIMESNAKEQDLRIAVLFMIFVYCLVIVNRES